MFSATQGPENLHNPRQPSQRPSLLIDRITRCQPVSDAGERLAEKGKGRLGAVQSVGPAAERSEEHTSELQSHSDLVCRLLLEKKNTTKPLADGPALPHADPIEPQ